MDQFKSFLGIFALIGIAYALSDNRKRVSWRLVVIGVILQVVFAILIFNPVGKTLFSLFNDLIMDLLSFTTKGSEFVFNSLADPSKIGFNFTFQIMPTIIFFSSLMAILYYLGIMQKVVNLVAKIMSKTMGTSGAESLSAAANIFVGQTEAPLVIRPYIEKMTFSELMAVMTGGMATVAGGVLAAYVGFLKVSIPNIAGHLLAASIMSAPAALVIAKIMVPETEKSATSGQTDFEMEIPDENAIDAAARGASEGMQLAINVVAMLLAFIALLALVNAGVGKAGDMIDGAFRGAKNFGFSTPELKTETLADIKKRVKEGETLELTLTNASNYSEKIYQITSSSLKEGHIELSQRLPGPKLAAGEIGMFPPKLLKLEGVAFKINQSGNKEPLLQGKLALSVTDPLTIQMILGWLFAPFAFIMGVAWKDCMVIGGLLGEKIILTEFLAYLHLGEFLQNHPGYLEPRSAVIASYALCGFANFGSIGIQLGGIGGLAPSRRGDLAKLGLKSMIAGCLAAFMTATVAGMFKSL